jgi:hypothetical protein
MTFLKLLTTPFIITMTEVQAIIREKEFMQYPSPMKSEVNIRNHNKFYFFHHDH